MAKLWVRFAQTLLWNLTNIDKQFLFSKSDLDLDLGFVNSDSDVCKISYTEVKNTDIGGKDEVGDVGESTVSARESLSK